MENKKPFWKSKTLWGYFFLFLPNVLAIVEENTGVNISSTSVTSLCMLVATTFGGKAIHEKSNLKWKK